MKLKKIYDLIISSGIQNDPRGEEAVRLDLKKAKERYQAMTEKEKTFFDTESLRNPYHDSRLLVGDPEREIKTILSGIDIDAAELLLADRLKDSKHKKIDCVLSHHPQGTAYAGLYEVMGMHAGIYEDLGIPINIAEGLTNERKREISRRLHAANHQRTKDTAALLDIPLLCAHTAADNHAVAFLKNLFDRHKPQTLQDILNILLDIPEYRIAAKNNAPPVMLFGTPQNSTGKIFIDMTGGTEGPKDIVDHLLAAGVGTIVGMHVSEDFYKKLQGKNINVIVAGHISSDSLGMNLLLDKIEKTGHIKIIPCSGLTRVKRQA